MIAACHASRAQAHIRVALAVGTHRTVALPPAVAWYEASHPLPDARSVTAGRHARDIARSVSGDEGVLLLLSGGASSLLALPDEGLTLEDKQHTIRRMMHAGADIHALNTVRKHLSAIKGGRLAAECRGAILTLAVSDVMDDDVSVIGSGPGVPDPTTWADASAALDRWGGAAHPAAVRAHVAEGVAGRLPDTPKPGAPAVSHARGWVVASREDALVGARRAAEALGYRVTILAQPITGEARLAAQAWFAAAQRARAATPAPACVLSAGETTVRVTGDGRGGRNQEFALALADAVSRSDDDIAVSSVGTDGIDGPTDAAGAIVTTGTLARAARLGLLPPRHYLEQNDSYAFFDALDDLIRIGPTDTNVGDLQILLAAPS
jgi:glycerate 2-kinase